MNIIENLEIIPTPLINHEGLQRIDIECITTEDMHVKFEVFCGDKNASCNIGLANGGAKASAMLPVPEKDCEALCRIMDKNGNVLCEKKFEWKKPREWELYVMISSHTDIGLHNSQYIQRYNSVKFLDKAMELSDQTNGKYHYVMEGTWFWNNYSADKGTEKAKDAAEKYIKTRKIGLCAGIAGNHTQVYGLEELCRSTYERNRLKQDWGIDVKTMTMIDNNGMSWAMIQPYADAGYENIIFAPNTWNPIPSTVWKCDTDIDGFTWSSNANGGGARMDIRYSSILPMVFYWCDASGERKMLVWGSTQYEHGGEAFGMNKFTDSSNINMSRIENRTAGTLTHLEKKVPYDTWLFACYGDDQEPDVNITEAVEKWNMRWKWPHMQTLSNPDEPFERLKRKYDDEIPILKGDITGGWYQHPLSAPDLLARKFEADRMLPTAEKLAVIAAMTNGEYLYPEKDFCHAWDYLLFNDEHSYGTSGYQGRRVYETWMQHRDWIDKAIVIAHRESERTLEKITETIASDYDGVVVFNPTLIERNEIIKAYGKEAYVEKIPPLGYKTVRADRFTEESDAKVCDSLPVVENDFYVVMFSENGSISSIYDKELKKELLDSECEYNCNEFVYTSDNHNTFHTPRKASFMRIDSEYETVIISTAQEENSGAEIVQKVTLPKKEKRIDIDNRLNHVYGLFNNNRYYRYCYYAFPFKIDNAKRYCHLNGCIAEYGSDVTGHGTDVYMAVREWCCAQNESYGVALMQLDSCLIEFDRIHPDKTDYKNIGPGAGMYSYLANDWLQMYTAGGSHLNFRFRYSITSYRGSYTDAGIEDMAERYADPVLTSKIKKQTGNLGNEHSFCKGGAGMRLTALKRAEDGKGIIARMYIKGDNQPIMPTDVKYSVKRNSIDETDFKNNCKNENGFVTYRIGEEKIRINVLPDKKTQDSPAPIGSVYTGLITEPIAARGENDGQLYLLWGRNMDEDLAYYELYRSEKSGFTPDRNTFLTFVEPEPYRVSRYVDTGLENHKEYFYRVCAVNKAGEKSVFSKEFSGVTKEEIKEQ